VNLTLDCAKFALEIAIVSESHMFISVAQIAAFFILTLLYLDNVQLTVIVLESYGASHAMTLDCRMCLAAHGPRALMLSAMTMTISVFCLPAYLQARSTMLESALPPQTATYVANAKEIVTMIHSVLRAWFAPIVLVSRQLWVVLERAAVEMFLGKTSV